MKKIILPCLLLSVFSAQSVQAVDTQQARSRNDVIEEKLLILRMQKAGAMLADTTGGPSSGAEVNQLNRLVQTTSADVSSQNTSQVMAQQRQVPNMEHQRLQEIIAAKEAVEDLAQKYSKQVYGSKTPENWKQDPFLANFVDTLKVLKRMEEYPAKREQLEPELEAQVAEMNALIEIAKEQQ